ncbi:class I SAM-dependent methyltransferase [Neorhodopirellula pilleata]|uniref:Methyltransferase domain-containing protein n=1 Tax=Neorhodopirellula pilleata TaxID=2714738 RepID=A0A5C6A029_9BACT|nr:class I SAM-dependent methyltransferase [Neorhodopirellula pilleata]TWT92641.1 hypothetical protein Pla100_46610 [Neorhodopirellula pilleata]
MKVRDSGMPEEAYWETLFDPVQAISGFPFIANSTASDRLLELGCGYGTFTVELAKRFRGRLDTFDIDPSMVQRTTDRLSDAGLKNAFVYQGNFVAADLPDHCRDYGVVVLFHIMHLENPEDLLRRVLSRVRPGGMLAFLHWRPDQITPRGPDMEIRPTLADYQRWSEQFHLTPPIEAELLDCPHHFAVYCQTSEPT